MSELTTPTTAAEAEIAPPPPSQILPAPLKTAVIVLHGVADQKQSETVMVTSSSANDR